MTTRAKINLISGEIEFEGTEEFVKDQLASIPTLLGSLKFSDQLVNLSTSARAQVGDDNSSPNEQVSANDPGGIPQSFGEWMHKFPDDILDQDKILLASFYVQKNSEKNDFKTSEVNRTLKDHGVKLSNPSAFLNRLVAKKHMFQTRKEGKLKFLRVSKDGETRISELLSSDN